MEVKNVRTPILPNLHTATTLAELVFVLVVLLILAVPARAQVDTLDLPAVSAEEVADAQVEQRLRRVFSLVDEFEDVQVEVQDGVVHLSGSVLRSETRERAGALAARFDGVLYVDNDVEQETEVETRVAPALQKVQEFWEGLVTLLPVLGVALLVVLLFAVVGEVLRRWEAPFRWVGIHPLVSSLLRRVLRLLVVLAGLLLALDILDATALVGALLGTAGIAGLALGFAFRDIVENYLAGVLLSLRRPFEAGDHVLIDTYEGKVTQLTSREMIIMTLDGNHVRLPNATVFGSAITNYTRNPRRRFHFVIGVGPDEKPREAAAAGRRALEAMPGVMEEPPPFVLLEEVGDSALLLRFHGWVDQREADYAKTRSEAVRLVVAALEEAGVSIPEPAYQVTVHEQGEAAEPSRKEPPVAEQARDADVAPNRQLDAQIAEDLAQSTDENLL